MVKIAFGMKRGGEKIPGVARGYLDTIPGFFTFDTIPRFFTFSKIFGHETYANGTAKF